MSGRDRMGTLEIALRIQNARRDLVALIGEPATAAAVGKAAEQLAAHLDGKPEESELHEALHLLQGAASVIEFHALLAAYYARVERRAVAAQCLDAFQAGYAAGSAASGEVAR